MAGKAKEWVRLRGNVTIPSFLSLCTELFDLFPSYKEWGQIFCGSSYYVFFLDKICEVLFIRFLECFGNLTCNLVKNGRCAEYNYIFNKFLSDFFTYHSGKVLDEAFFKLEDGILYGGEDLLYFMNYSSLGLGLIDLLPALKYFSLHGFSVWCEDDEFCEFIENLKEDENTEKEIVSYFLPEVMRDDPDYFRMSQIADFVPNAAMYASDEQIFEIYENRCLKAYHDWLLSADVESHGVEPVIAMIERCEDILSNSNTDYISMELIKTPYACYLSRMSGFDGTESVMVDDKFVYPMAFFAIVIIDILLQELNNRFHFFIETEERR